MLCEYCGFLSLTSTDEFLINFLGAQAGWAPSQSVALTSAGARAGLPGPLGCDDHRIIRYPVVQSPGDPVPQYEYRSEALQYMGSIIVLQEM